MVTLPAYLNALPAYLDTLPAYLNTLPAFEKMNSGFKIIKYGRVKDFNIINFKEGH